MKHTALVGGDGEYKQTMNSESQEDESGPRPWLCHLPAGSPKAAIKP